MSGIRRITTSPARRKGDVAVPSPSIGSRVSSTDSVLAGRGVHPSKRVHVERPLSPVPAPVCLEYYDLLGVRPQSSRAEIRRRYQQLSESYATEGASMRSALRTAGQVLTNKELRYIYDRFGKNGVETFNSVRYETWSANDQPSTWLILVGGWSVIILWLDGYFVFPLEWILATFVSLYTGFVPFVAGLIAHVLRTNYYTSSRSLALFLTVLVVLSLDSAIFFAIPNPVLSVLANTMFCASFLLSLNPSIDQFRPWRTLVVFILIVWMDQQWRVLPWFAVSVRALPFAAHTLLFGGSYTAFQMIRLVTSRSRHFRGTAQRLGTYLLNTFDWLRRQRYGYELMVIWIPIWACSSLLQFPVEYLLAPVVGLPVLLHGSLSSRRIVFIRAVLFCALLPLLSHLLLLRQVHATLANALLYFTTLFIAGDRSRYQAEEAAEEDAALSDDSEDEASAGGAATGGVAAAGNLLNGASRILNTLNSVVLTAAMLLLDFSTRLSHPHFEWPLLASLSSFCTLLLFVSHLKN